MKTIYIVIRRTDDKKGIEFFFQKWRFGAHWHGSKKTLQKNLTNIVKMVRSGSGYKDMDFALIWDKDAEKLPEETFYQWWERLDEDAERYVVNKNRKARYGPTEGLYYPGESAEEFLARH